MRRGVLGILDTLWFGSLGIEHLPRRKDRRLQSQQGAPGSHGLLDRFQIQQRIQRGSHRKQPFEIRVRFEIHESKRVRQERRQQTTHPVQRRSSRLERRLRKLSLHGLEERYLRRLDSLEPEIDQLDSIDRALVPMRGLRRVPSPLHEQLPVVRARVVRRSLLPRTSGADGLQG